MNRLLALDSTEMFRPDTDARWRDRSNAVHRERGFF